MAISDLFSVAIYSNSKDQQYNEDASRHKRTIYG